MHNHALGGRIIQLNVLRRNLFRKKSAGCALYDGQRPMMETIVCHPGCTQQELASMLCITAVCHRSCKGARTGTAPRIRRGGRRHLCRAVGAGS